MNEVRAIVEAYDTATARGERCALATVVSVEGSAYRRPGARMLVCEGGSSAGTISAGCLERDVVEHAGRVFRLDTPNLLEFDTSSASDEVAWGLGLGCNGIVRVLLEPLAPTSLCMRALRSASAIPADAAGIRMATVFGSSGGVEPGARLVIEEDGKVSYERLSHETASRLEREMRPCAPLRDGTRTVAVDGAAVSVFFETLLPPVPLVVFGAGHDALPVVELAHGLGWHTEVVDPQARPASRARFAVADRVTLSRPDDIAGSVGITPRTLALLMSHNYGHDLALLGFLLRSPARYIGVMGPRSRTERMLSELAAFADLDLLAADRARLHAPVGLDIGADGPLEIGLSIVAEMRAVLDGRPGGMLRGRHGATHVGSLHGLELLDARRAGA